MSVDATAPSYDEHLPLWQKMRQVAAGEEAVKEAGDEYLPMLGGQEGKQYEAYKARASFLNATARTIDGLSGMIFRKPPQVEPQDAMADFLADVDGCGLPFQAFAENVVEDMLTVSRGGLLVDFPTTDGAPRTQAQAISEGRRPYWTWYTAEAIIGWQTRQIDNRTVVSLVRLHEQIEEEADEEFGSEEAEQIRVLELAGVVDAEGEPTGAYQYQQRLFRKGEDGEWEQWGDTIVPLLDGRAMTEIPFIFFGPRDLLPRVSRPVLLDLANKNLDHYRLDADYHHGLHFVALPTPWGKGVKSDEISQGAFDAIGPTNIWLTSSADAEFGMLEFTGQGIGALRQALEDAKGEMAMLGARMLAPEKRQVEAAETANIHRMGENSVLASISQVIGMGLTRALEWAAMWMGVDADDASVDLNRDFLPAKMTPQETEALLKMWQAGGISFETLFDNLQRGEVIDAERTVEDEQGAIQDEAPAMPPVAGPLAAE